MKRSANGQAMVEDTIQIQPTAFDKQDKTSIYWLGNGGAMINSQGTVILIDPLLKDFDMPLLMNEMPLDPAKSDHVDAVLITHIDNDHYSRPTCTDLKAITLAISGLINRQSREFFMLVLALDQVSFANFHPCYRDLF